MKISTSFKAELAQRIFASPDLANVAIPPHRVDGWGIPLNSLTVEEPPDPHTIAEEGWGYTPGAGSKKMRSKVLQKGLENLSPKLKDQVEGDLRRRKVI